MSRFAIIYIFFISINCSAQYSNLGSWNSINLKYRIDKNFGLFAESQLRSLRFYNHFHYHEFKAGIDYTFTDFKLSLGAGKYDTYRQGGNFVEPKNNDEFRIWPQLSLFQNLGSKLTIEQRYRAEFRFATTGYRNRFRYRVGVSYPLACLSSARPVLISLSNELFFTDTQPYFERNRFCLLANYKLYDPISLQIGYLHQFDYKINDETGKIFFIVGIFFDLSKKIQTASSNQNREIKDN